MGKFLKVCLLITLAIIVIILFDTIQAIIFEHSPIISWKYQKENDKSWVDKGIFVDTYYCVKEKDIVTVYIKNKYSKFKCPIENIETDSNESNQKIIKVLDSLYYETTKKSTVRVRCGNMDGYIDSSVEQNEIPNSNNQSNFGTGYGYQIFGDIVEVFIDGKIIVFEQR